MNKALLLLMMLAGPVSTFLPAQQSDYTIQPNAKTNVTAAVAVEDGYLWVTNGINPNQKGLPVIQKWDKEGIILWSTPLSLNGDCIPCSYTESYFSDIRVSEHQILVSGMALCDEWSIPIFFVLDADGHVLDSLSILKPRFYFLSSISPINADQFFPLVLLMDAELYRMDSLHANLVKLGVKGNYNGLTLKSNGQVLVALQQKGVAVVDPMNGTILDTIHADIANVNFIYETSQNNLLLAGTDEFFLLDDHNNVIATKQHSLGAIIGGFFDGQTWFLHGYSDVHRFDSALNYMGVLSNPTNDATIKFVLPGDTHHWAFGNESFNAFRLALEFEGMFDPPVTDVALTWLQAEKVDLTILNPYQYEMTVKGVQLTIKNNGPDTLNSLVINWKLPLDLCPVCGTGYDHNRSFNFLTIDDLNVPPGETTIINQGMDTFYRFYTVICPNFDQIYNELCFELSIPNQRIDANQGNDRVCLPINFISLTSATDQSHLHSIQTFPNPFSSNITISGIPDNCASIDIYDGLGRAMQRITPTSETLTIDLSANGRGLNHLVFRRSDGIILRYETLIKAN